MSIRCAIGFDIGGTKMAAGLVDLRQGTVLSRMWQATGAERGGAAVLADVVSMTQSLLKEATSMGLQPLGLGVGLPELVSPSGKIMSKATLDWEHTNVTSVLGKILPVRLEADVRAAARAEARWGAGWGLATFIYVTVGTGISSCLVLSGVPFTGARGLTGTFASARNLIPGDDGDVLKGPPLETYAGGTAISRRYCQLVGSSGVGTAEILDLAEAGNTEARRVVRTGGSALGAAIAQLVNVLDPEAIVLGGGLGLAGRTFRGAVEQALRDHVWSEQHSNVPLLDAQLGTDAGIIGAALVGGADAPLHANPTAAARNS